MYCSPQMNWRALERSKEPETAGNYQSVRAVSLSVWISSILHDASQ